MMYVANNGRWSSTLTTSLSHHPDKVVIIQARGLKLAVCGPAACGPRTRYLRPVTHYLNFKKFGIKIYVVLFILQHVPSSKPAKLLFFSLACWCWQPPTLTPDSRSPSFPSLAVSVHSRGIQRHPRRRKMRHRNPWVGNKIKQLGKGGQRLNLVS